MNYAVATYGLGVIVIALLAVMLAVVLFVALIVAVVAVVVAFKTVTVPLAATETPVTAGVTVKL